MPYPLLLLFACHQQKQQWIHVHGPRLQQEGCEHSSLKTHAASEFIAIVAGNAGKAHAVWQKLTLILA